MTNVMERPGKAGPVGEERRTALRSRVLKGATLTFNRGYGAFECLVRNVSERGAKLSFGETSAVPGAFDLIIRGDSAARFAHVRWRTLTDLGVEFDSAREQGGLPGSAVVPARLRLGAVKGHATPVLLAPAQLRAIGDAVEGHIEQKFDGQAHVHRQAEFRAVLVHVLIVQLIAELVGPDRIAAPFSTRRRCSRGRCHSGSSAGTDMSAPGPGSRRADKRTLTENALTGRQRGIARS